MLLARRRAAPCPALAGRQARGRSRPDRSASPGPATGQARDHHRQALGIARDIGAALEEARALEGIGHSYLQEGNPSHAGAHLRDSLAVYQRIGSPHAHHVQETLASIR